MITAQELIDFEQGIADLFNSGGLPGRVVHLSGGNEEQLIDIFDTYPIGREDWVFSTWRSHYHALLKGIDPKVLRQRIIDGDSMHLMNKEFRFFSSSIVAGCLPIATGVALAIKRNGGDERVFCFLGDGAEDQGVTYESIRYAQAWALPILFIIEDNGLSVDTTSKERNNGHNIRWETKVVRYHYTRKWPHCQTGVMVKEYM